MKTASIIAVGSELMRGKMNDTNSTFLARWFDDIGIKVINRINVSDNINDIAEAVRICSDSDIIISTGGLGPTDDDLTRNGFAEYLNVPLIFDENVWEELKKYFIKLKYPLSDSNKRQAMLFENGGMLPNKNGTACGLYYNQNGKLFILLPGPPSENIPMINNYVYPLLMDNGFITGSIHSRIIRVYDGGESFLADLFSDIDEEYFDEVGYYFSQEAFVELHFRKYFDNGKINFSEFEKAFDVYASLLKREKIFYTENKSISLIFKELLERNNLKVSFAESCTGGAISHEFVKNPGASSVYNGGINAYSNDAKIRILGVSEDTVKEYGAVSEETVREMCLNAASLFTSDVSIAVSGIAGPDGGSEEKPVGLVCFGFYYKGNITTESHVFSGNRERVMGRTVTKAYKRIIELMS